MQYVLRHNDLKRAFLWRKYMYHAIFSRKIFQLHVRVSVNIQIHVLSAIPVFLNNPCRDALSEFNLLVGGRLPETRTH